MAGRTQRWLVILMSLCMSMLLCIPVWAANDPVFRLEADNLNLQKGVSSTIVLSIINAKDVKVNSIEGIENFDILSQSQSTSTSIVNNVMTQQVDVYYTVMPKTAGEFTLKANISYNGVIYETNPLDVSVTESSGNSGTAQDVFIETALSHEDAYIGEKIILTYYLYSRLSIDEAGFTDYIAIDGVIAAEIPQDQLKAETVYIDGYNYTKYELGQYIIDPIKTGVCVIPSFNLQVNVIVESSMGGAFGGLGGLFRSAEPRYLQTEEKELLVKPLPTEGKPADFSGIVGELRLEGSYSRNELSYGDSLALQIEASGNCNLDGLKSLFGSDVLGFTSYETQKDTTETVENGQYYAKKAFEVILIPERTGELKVPPVLVSYFNPTTGKYETVEIEEAVIKVLGDMPESNGSSSGVSAGFETVLINQVSYQENTSADDYFTIRMEKGMLYAILGGVAVLAAAGSAMTWLLISRRKQSTALKALYKHTMGAKDVNDMYNGFNAIIKQCLNLNLKASSKSSIVSSLTDGELAAQITDIMDYMESANEGSEKGCIILKEKIRNVYTKKLKRL